VVEWVELGEVEFADVRWCHVLARVVGLPGVRVWQGRVDPVAMLPG
jgi:hypothetical protein